MSVSVAPAPAASGSSGVNDATVNVWSEIRPILALANGSISDGDAHAVDINKFKTNLGQFRAGPAARFVVDWFFNGLANNLRTRVAPQFWATFKGLGDDDGTNEEDRQRASVAHEKAFLTGFQQVLATLQPHVDNVSGVAEFLSILEAVLGVRQLYSRWQCTVSAVLFTSAPSYVHDAIRHFFDFKFDQFHALYHLRRRGDPRDAGGRDDSASDDSSCAMDVDDPSDVWDEVAPLYQACLAHRLSNIDSSETGTLPSWARSDQFSQFHDLCVQVSTTGILALCGRMVASRLYSKIHEHVHQRCTGNFESRYLHELEDWLNSAVLPWLRLIFSTEDVRASGETPLYQQWRTRLHFYLHEVLGRMRITETFDIVVDFPDSLPAVEDLKACLEVTHQHQEMIRSFRASLEKRLLHPGANTADMITQYVSAIKALRTLDPSGVILDVIAQPIREYLRSRTDTIRCIVSALTDDENSDLFGQLGDQETNLDDEGGESDDDVSPSWTPAPIESNPERGTGYRRASDIISMLVNIYGSKDLFVNEYRLMLAEKLMGNLDFETDKEVRTLELLKLRFGEASLHNCGIMVRDIEDSKRINANLVAKLQHTQDLAQGVLDGAVFDTKIVSRLFWPTIPEEKFTVPEDIGAYHETFDKHYQEVKAPRKLVYYPQLGHVEIELEFDSGKLPFTVTPLHASIIHLFQDKEVWTCDELSTKLEMPADKLNAKMSYWMNHDVIHASRSGGSVTYTLNPNPTKQDGKGGGPAPAGDDATFSSEAQGEEEMKVYETFVIGMLTNFDSAPLDRLHNMLKMVVQDPPYDITEEQLASFLQRLVKEGKLVMAGRNYKLKK